MTDSQDVVTVEREIHAPADKIFDVVADPRRHHQIDGSGTVREAKNAPERLSMGARFGMSMKLGMPYSMVSEVIEFDDGKRIAWQTRPPGALWARMFGGRIWRYELEPTADGTLVRESWDVSQEKGPVKRLLRFDRTREQTRASMAATLAKIDALVAES
jgi:uncharacterized protein YndB with AHSA1/START domain